MDSNYKIAYLSSKNSLDRKSSSGVYFYQSEALKNHCGQVDFLGPVYSFPIKVIYKVLQVLENLFHVSFLPSHNTWISRIYGKIFSRKLKGKEQGFDFVFAEKASCEIAFLKTKLPLVYSTDATVAVMENYYPGFSDLLPFARKSAHAVEQRAINNAALIICASQWAARSVIEDYHANPFKVKIIPRGANIDPMPAKDLVLARTKNQVCQLLFMGNDWKRKGYQLAFLTMQYLRSTGFKVRLVAVGFNPPAELKDQDVEVYAYIDKNKPEGRELFQQIMLRADFLFIPTRAECQGITFCEASAYGLPIITTDTGGVTEVVKNGINGYALPMEAGCSEYAETIEKTFDADEVYFNLVRKSRTFYEERLSWAAWCKDFRHIANEHFGEG